MYVRTYVWLVRSSILVDDLKTELPDQNVRQNGWGPIAIPLGLPISQIWPQILLPPLIFYIVHVCYARIEKSENCKILT
jgi:hypothetical protein